MEGHETTVTLTSDAANMSIPEYGCKMFRPRIESKNGLSVLGSGEGSDSNDLRDTNGC